MDTLEKAYSHLWNLVRRNAPILNTLDFDAVCRRIGAPRKELDALLVKELGFSGDELLIALCRKSEQNFFIQMQNAQ